MRVPLLGWCVITLGLALAGTAVQAQDYPKQPIRVIASSGPGGISDIFIRAVGEELQRRWGQPLIVDNRPGASNNIAARACADAEPDGYTICIIPESVFLYNPYMFKTMPFDPGKDLTPVSHLFDILQVIVVNASLKVKTLDELADLSKKEKGTLSYIAPAIGQDIVFETLIKETGADLVRVPFRGGGQAVAALMTGTTPIASLGLGNVIGHIRSGKMVAIAIHGHQRSPLFPDVPTLREIGYKGDFSNSTFGLWAPAGTPPDIIARLQREIRDIAMAPEFRQKRLIDQGLTPQFLSPADTRTWLEELRPITDRIAKTSSMVPR